MLEPKDFDLIEDIAKSVVEKELLQTISLMKYDEMKKQMENNYLLERIAKLEMYVEDMKKQLS